MDKSEVCEIVSNSEKTVIKRGMEQLAHDKNPLKSNIYPPVLNHTYFPRSSRIPIQKFLKTNEVSSASDKTNLPINSKLVKKHRKNSGFTDEHVKRKWSQIETINSTSKKTEKRRNDSSIGKGSRVKLVSSSDENISSKSNASSRTRKSKKKKVEKLIKNSKRSKTGVTENTGYAKKWKLIANSAVQKQKRQIEGGIEELYRNKATTKIIEKYLIADRANASDYLKETNAAQYNIAKSETSKQFTSNEDLLQVNVHVQNVHQVKSIEAIEIDLEVLQSQNVSSETNLTYDSNQSTGVTDDGKYCNEKKCSKVDSTIYLKSLDNTCTVISVSQAKICASDSIRKFLEHEVVIAQGNARGVSHNADSSTEKHNDKVDEILSETSKEEFLTLITNESGSVCVDSLNYPSLVVDAKKPSTRSSGNLADAYGRSKIENVFKTIDSSLDIATRTVNRLINISMNYRQHSDVIGSESVRGAIKNIAKETENILRDAQQVGRNIQGDITWQHNLNKKLDGVVEIGDQNNEANDSAINVENDSAIALHEKVFEAPENELQFTEQDEEMCQKKNVPEPVKVQQHSDQRLNEEVGNCDRANDSYISAIKEELDTVNRLYRDSTDDNKELKTIISSNIASINENKSKILHLTKSTFVVLKGLGAKDNENSKTSSSVRSDISKCSENNTVNSIMKKEAVGDIKSSIDKETLSQLSNSDNCEKINVMKSVQEPRKMIPNRIINRQELDVQTDIRGIRKLFQKNRRITLNSFVKRGEDNFTDSETKPTAVSSKDIDSDLPLKSCHTDKVDISSETLQKSSITEKINSTIDVKSSTDDTRPKCLIEMFRNNSTFENNQDVFTKDILSTPVLPSVINRIECIDEQNKWPIENIVAYEPDTITDDDQPRNIMELEHVQKEHTNPNIPIAAINDAISECKEAIKDKIPKSKFTLEDATLEDLVERAHFYSNVIQSIIGIQTETAKIIHRRDQISKSNVGNTPDSISAIMDENALKEEDCEVQLKDNKKLFDPEKGGTLNNDLFEDCLEENATNNFEASKNHVDSDKQTVVNIISTTDSSANKGTVCASLEDLIFEVKSITNVLKDFDVAKVDEEQVKALCNQKQSFDKFFDALDEVYELALPIEQFNDLKSTRNKIVKKHFLNPFETYTKDICDHDNVLGNKSFQKVIDFSLEKSNYSSLADSVSQGIDILEDSSLGETITNGSVTSNSSSSSSVIQTNTRTIEKTDTLLMEFDKLSIQNDINKNVCEESESTSEQVDGLLDVAESICNNLAYSCSPQKNRTLSKFSVTLASQEKTRKVFDISSLANLPSNSLTAESIEFEGRRHNLRASQTQSSNPSISESLTREDTSYNHEESNILVRNTCEESQERSVTLEDLNFVDNYFGNSSQTSEVDISSAIVSRSRSIRIPNNTIDQSKLFTQLLVKNINNANSEQGVSRRKPNFGMFTFKYVDSDEDKTYHDIFERPANTKIYKIVEKKISDENSIEENKLLSEKPKKISIAGIHTIAPNNSVTNFTCVSKKRQLNSNSMIERVPSEILMKPDRKSKKGYRYKTEVGGNDSDKVDIADERIANENSTECWLNNEPIWNEKSGKSKSGNAKNFILANKRINSNAVKGSEIKNIPQKQNLGANKKPCGKSTSLDTKNLQGGRNCTAFRETQSFGTKSKKKLSKSHPKQKSKSTKVDKTVPANSKNKTSVQAKNDITSLYFIDDCRTEIGSSNFKKISISSISSYDQDVQPVVPPANPRHNLELSKGLSLKQRAIQAHKNFLQHECQPRSNRGLSPPTKPNPLNLSVPPVINLSTRNHSPRRMAQMYNNNYYPYSQINGNPSRNRDSDVPISMNEGWLMNASKRSKMIVYDAMRRNLLPPRSSIFQHPPNIHYQTPVTSFNQQIQSNQKMFRSKVSSMYSKPTGHRKDTGFAKNKKSSMTKKPEKVVTSKKRRVAVDKDIKIRKKRAKPRRSGKKSKKNDKKTKRKIYVGNVSSKMKQKSYVSSVSSTSTSVDNDYQGAVQNLFYNSISASAEIERRLGRKSANSRKSVNFSLNNSQSVKNKRLAVLSKTRRTQRNKPGRISVVVSKDKSLHFSPNAGKSVGENQTISTTGKTILNGRGLSKPINVFKKTLGDSPSPNTTLKLSVAKESNLRTGSPVDGKLMQKTGAFIAAPNATVLKINRPFPEVPSELAPLKPFQFSAKTTDYYRQSSRM